VTRPSLRAALAWRRRIPLAVVFGTPLALLLARRDFRGKWLADVLVDLPIILPPTVAGLAFAFDDETGGA